MLVNPFGHWSTSSSSCQRTCVSADRIFSSCICSDWDSFTKSFCTASLFARSSCSTVILLRRSPFWRSSRSSSRSATFSWPYSRRSLSSARSVSVAQSVSFCTSVLCSSRFLCHCTSRSARRAASFATCSRSRSRLFSQPAVRFRSSSCWRARAASWAAHRSHGFSAGSPSGGAGWAPIMPSMADVCCALLLLWLLWLLLLLLASRFGASRVALYVSISSYASRSFSFSDLISSSSGTTSERNTSASSCACVFVFDLEKN
uniref:Uncharacterized protein n=1 Tax=Anopheles merus TaxID=30066 RepID=A0A182UT58_ANOME